MLGLIQILKIIGFIILSITFITFIMFENSKSNIIKYTVFYILGLIFYFNLF